MTPQELSNLFQTLRDDKDLMSKKIISWGWERTGFGIKEITRCTCELFSYTLDCILASLPSVHSPTGILMQGEDHIFKWVFLPYRVKIKDVCRDSFWIGSERKIKTSSVSKNKPRRIVVPLPMQ